MQLERLLRSQGFGSRPECRRMIWRGEVYVDGTVCENPLAEFDPIGLFRFSVNGEEWVYRASTYLILNKPAHYECSHKPVHHPSVYSLLLKPLINRGVQAVGRLDEDTTGLLLLSDDGQFIHHYTSPKRNIPKAYDVFTKHPITASLIASLLEGVKLSGEPELISAVSCELHSEQLMRMVVTEGKYHLVKRMVAAAGNRVDHLNRVSVGGLDLPEDLPIGQWRWLEAADLKRLAGG